MRVHGVAADLAQPLAYLAVLQFSE